MPLNWSVAACKNFKDLQEGREWNITNHLIWQSMNVGINEITIDNIPEFIARLSVWEALSDAHLTIHNEETDKCERYDIKVSDMVKRIGMWTNASTLTDAKFKSSIKSYIDRWMKESKHDSESLLKRD
jgi:hypothetical protein